MSFWESFLFGAVQGLTEYLPISSSAHLVLLPRFLRTPDPGLTFDVFLHAGTLAATLWYFRKDWRDLVFRDRRMLAWILVGTVPALGAGYLVHDWAETVFRGPGVLVLTLSLFGALLWWVDRKAGAGGRSVSGRTTIVMGVSQCLALIPGVSRSGITLTVGRRLGLSRPEAARVSFLLSAPVTAAALGYETLKVLRAPTGLSVDASSLLIASLSAFAFGVFAIDVLVQRVSRVGYGGFAIYRVGLAIVLWFTAIS